ncbi:hypothetical protein RRG08_004338 [Elysia crispata]|uniref:Transmembrane protein n=1 Tax=Elysia crispata TaxID=231223 RepID=A0AAE1E6F8_9GAST|nr:hypothetical protein RRG08_004338 [Elysia crispata]
MNRDGSFEREDMCLLYSSFMGSLRRLFYLLPHGLKPSPKILLCVCLIRGLSLTATFGPFFFFLYLVERFESEVR